MSRPPSGPSWQEDFPVTWIDDAFVTRRELARTLGLVSFATFAATATLAMVHAWRGSPRRRGSHPPVRVATLDQIPVGGSRSFFYPGPDDPCLLLRPTPERVVAFSQRCTHLGCPVVHRPEGDALYCPCHHGFFSPRDGHATAGPPRRRLTRIEIEIRDGECWAVGVLP